MYRRNLRVLVVEIESKKSLANVNKRLCEETLQIRLFTPVSRYRSLYRSRASLLPFFFFLMFLTLVRFHPRVLDFFLHLHNLTTSRLDLVRVSRVSKS